MSSVMLLGGLAVLAAALLVAGLRWPVLLVLGVLFLGLVAREVGQGPRPAHAGNH